MNLPVSGPLLKKSKLAAQIEGEITPEDLAERVASDLGVAPVPLKTLRSIHHHAARLLAEGHQDCYVSQIVGYSASRLSVLKSDPAFKELVQFYVKRNEAIYVDVSVRLGAISEDALAELHERLADNPESLSPTTLMELAKLSLDRTGHGPQTKNDHRHQHVHLSAEDLKAIRDGVERNEGKATEVIDSTPTKTSEGKGPQISEHASQPSLHTESGEGNSGERATLRTGGREMLEETG